MLPKSVFRCFIFLIWTIYFKLKEKHLKDYLVLIRVSCSLLLNSTVNFEKVKAISMLYDRNSHPEVFFWRTSENDCLLYEAKHRIMDVSKLVKSQALSNTWKSIILVSSQNYVKPGLLMVTPNLWHDPVEKPISNFISTFSFSWDSVVEANTSRNGRLRWTSSIWSRKDLFWSLS